MAPAAIVDRRGRRWPPRRWPRPSRAAARARRPAAAATARSWPAPCAQRAGSNVAGSAPEPHEVEEQRRASRGWTGRRTRRSAARSRRRWIEVSTIGTASEMNPGLLPVLWIDVPPRRAGRLDPGPRPSGSMLAGWWNSPAVVTTLSARRQQAAHLVDVAALGHVEDAVGARGPGRRRSRRWRSRRSAPSPHSSPASTARLVGASTRTRRPGRGAGAR